MISTVTPASWIRARSTRRSIAVIASASGAPVAWSITVTVGAGGVAGTAGVPGVAAVPGVATVPGTAAVVGVTAVLGGAAVVGVTGAAGVAGDSVVSPPSAGGAPAGRSTRNARVSVPTLPAASRAVTVR